MKKVVVKLEVNNDKSKTKAMKIVSSNPGVDSVSMDMEDKKLTVTGDMDPVVIMKELRKSFSAKIELVEPVKKKKVEPKKEEEPNLCFPQKVVVKLDVNDDKSKTKAMKIFLSIAGVDSVSKDEDKKLTVTGDVDPVEIMKQLRKSFSAELVSVEPVKKKKEEPKKKDKDEEPKDPTKKEEPKRKNKDDEPKDPKKKEEPKKKEKKEEPKKLEEKKKH